MRTLLVIAFSMSFCLPAISKEWKPDREYIKRMPQMLKAARKKSEPGWDSGITSQMVEATDQYNQAVIQMMETLAAKYYPKKYLGNKEISLYVKKLNEIESLNIKLENPTGQFPGTITSVTAPAGVGAALRAEIVEMVRAITEMDASFDFAAWQKRWEKAHMDGKD